MRAKSVLIYVAVFVALAAVLFVGAFALNSYNVSHASSSSSVPSLFVGSTIKAKEAAELTKHPSTVSTSRRRATTCLEAET